jgi:hypothetical protein
VIIQEREVLARYAEEEGQLLLNDPSVVWFVENGLLDIDWHRRMVSPDFELFRGAPASVVTDATEGDDVPDSSVAAQKLLHRARKFGLGTCPMDLFCLLFDGARAKKQLREPSEWPCARPTAGALAEGETSPTSPDRAQNDVWR